MKALPKIIIVDDHRLFREGMRLLIESEGIGEVIAEAGSGKEFISLLKNLNPDLVLLDIEMPEMDGLEATKRAFEIVSNIKILVLTMQASKEDYVNIVNAGAMGFVLKTAGKQELQTAISSLLDGENYFSKEILHKVVSGFISHSENGGAKNEKEIQLTNKEVIVLNYLCKGLSPNEIAQTIHRSVKTVEMHRSKLLEKTNTKNTINLILFAIKNKLVKV